MHRQHTHQPPTCNPPESRSLYENPRQRNKVDDDAMRLNACSVLVMVAEVGTAGRLEAEMGIIRRNAR